MDAAGAAPNKAGVDAGEAAPSPPVPPPKSPPPDGVAPGVCAPGSPGVCPPGAGSAAGAGAFEPGRPAGGAEANPGLSAIAESRAYSASAASASAKGSLCSPRRRSAARCSALARRTFSCRRARSPPTLLKYLCAPSTAALSSAGPAPDASNATPPNSSPPSLERPASRDPPSPSPEPAPPRSAAASASRPGPAPPCPCTRPVARTFRSISSVPRSKLSAAAYRRATAPFKNALGLRGGGRYTGVASGGGGWPGCVRACATPAASASSASRSRVSRARACSASRKVATTASRKPPSRSLSLQSCVSSSFSASLAAFAARSSSRRRAAPPPAPPHTPSPCRRDTPSRVLESSRAATIFASSAWSCCCECGASSPHCVKCFTGWPSTVASMPPCGWGAAS